MRRTKLDPEALTTVREERRLSQRALAQRVGISEQYVCDLEAGRRYGYNGDLRDRLAKALDIEVGRIETRAEVA